MKGQKGVFDSIFKFWAIVQRIQYFYLSIEKMSYMSVMPNCYYGNSSQSSLLASHYLTPQSHFNNATILQYLSSALKISVANYRLSQQQTLPPTSSAAQMRPVEPAVSKVLPNALELTITAQEYKENNQKQSEAQLKKAKNKLCPPEEKEPKKEPQIITDDELHHEDKERALKKSQLSRRQAKKEKEVALNEYVVPIPQVDLVETAYLPLFSMGRKELARKREEILLRMVENWGECPRGRKDKREIRMLSN